MEPVMESLNAWTQVAAHGRIIRFRVLTPCIYVTKQQNHSPDLASLRGWGKDAQKTGRRRRSRSVCVCVMVGAGGGGC